MTIGKQVSGNSLILRLEGRLDTITSKQLEAELGELDGKKSVTLDFADIAYVSSAGLRVLLAMQKKMNALQGELKLIHVHPDVNEVFEMTGFSEFLAIEM